MNRTLPDRHSPLLLALTSFCLLCLVAAGLHYQQLRTLQQMYQEAAVVRGQNIADDSAQKITHALSLGIPLQELIGVEAMLQSLRHQHPDLISIDIQDTQSRPLWSSQSSQSKQSFVQTSSVIQGPNKLTAASINVHVHPQQAETLLVQNLWMWLGLLSFLTALSYWAARLSFSQHPWLREDVVFNASSDIGRSVFQHAWLAPRPVTHDPRPEQLSAGIRAINEAKDRLQRLVQSLRQTEPSAQHRQQLDAILYQATQGLQLNATIERRRIYAIEQQCFWLSLMLVLASTSPWLWQLLVMHDIADHAFLAAALYLLSMLFMRSMGRYIKLPVMQILLTGFVVLFIAPFALPATSTGIATLASLSGAIAGLGYHAFHCVLYAAKRKFVFAHPRLSRPVDRAYLYVIVCFGPLLAALSKQSCNDEFAQFSLLLPATCGLLACLLWNSAISPWRTRIRSIPIQLHKNIRWIAACFYLAIGLGVASSMDSHTFPHAFWLIAGWVTGCFLRTNVHQAVRLSMSMIVLAAGVWCLFNPDELATAATWYVLAFGTARAHAKLRARRTWWAISTGVCAGLCINYWHPAALTLSISAILLGGSWLLCLHFSRSGVAK